MRQRLSRFATRTTGRLMEAIHERWSELPADGIPFPVSSLDLQVLPGPHPILAARDAITDNWRIEIAANPALFDGQIVLQHRVVLQRGLQGDVLAGEGYLAPFSAFLWWRRHRLPGMALHLAAMPVIETSDGAVIAVRMAAHTANPGRVYFAAGSIDGQDVVDGRCDVMSNMRREVREEIGLDLAEVGSVGPFYAFRQGEIVTLFRRFRFDVPASVLLARIDAFLASETDPEIEAAIAIRDADAGAHPYPAFMPVILRHVFKMSR